MRIHVEKRLTTGYIGMVILLSCDFERISASKRESGASSRDRPYSFRWIDSFGSSRPGSPAPPHQRNGLRLYASIRRKGPILVRTEHCFWRYHQTLARRIDNSATIYDVSHSSRRMDVFRRASQPY